MKKLNFFYYKAILRKREVRFKNNLTKYRPTKTKKDQNAITGNTISREGQNGEGASVVLEDRLRMFAFTGG